jgi:hypothetical protein
MDLDLIAIHRDMRANKKCQIFGLKVISCKKVISCTTVTVLETSENCVLFDRLLSLFVQAIAIHILDHCPFTKLFRGSKFLSKLWSRFFLAHHLMPSFGLHPQSVPDLPGVANHPLWTQFEANVIKIGAFERYGH